MDYALDTNVIINLLNRESAIVESFNETVANGNKIMILSIVDYEMQRGFHYKPMKRKKRFMMRCLRIAL
jgi:predicted nucleic acid-binding protein